jgi:3-phenylpropionate/trans-cinnamate dioxygenase ferredoxin subunit
MGGQGLMEYWAEAGEYDSFTEILGVDIEGFEIVLVKDKEGAVYALDNICSHEYSLLSDGEFWDGQLYCAKHGSRFDIKSGAVSGLPATQPVETFETKVEDGMIYVKLKV